MAPATGSAYSVTPVTQPTAEEAMPVHRLLLLLPALLLVAVPTLAADPPRAKHLLEFGWDEPDTAFMRQHAAEMDATPFDGVVFHPKGDIIWKTWSKKPFTEADLEPSLDDLKATQFTRLTRNFLRVNTAPADLDWFDDHAAVMNNLRLQARLAKDGGCRGILFDIEQYNGPLFNYPKQRDAKTKSWDEYARQVRLRGREAMAAFQDGYPGVTIFLTFGYSLPYTEAGGDVAKLPTVSYGLLAPFLDGMLDAAAGDTRLVDGHELSYGYKDPARFAKAYTVMKTGVLPFVAADHDKYAKHFSAAFGLWMDNNWRKSGWNTEDVSKNFFTPQAFEASVRTALQTTDEYVWIYTETPRWWTAEGKPAKLPKAYDEALRRAATSPTPSPRPGSEP
jgi:hypothetical protein